MTRIITTLGAVVRTFLSVVLAVLGTLLLLPGAVVAAVVGPDDTVSLPEGKVPADSGVAITAYDMFPLRDLQLHLTATSAGGPVFLGSAHPVDADDYLSGVAASWVRGVDRAGALTTNALEGELTAPEVDPRETTFWYDSLAGEGAQSLTVALSEEPVTFVVVPLGGPAATTLAFGAVVPGLFRVAAATAVAGLVLVVLAVVVRRRGRRRAPERLVPEAEGAASLTESPTPPASPAPEGSPEPVDPADVPTPHRGTPVVSRSASTVRRRALGLLTVASVATATACVPIPSSVELPDEPSRPAVFEDELDETVAEWTERLNAADALSVESYDVSGWAAAETEGVREAREFSIAVQRERGQAYESIAGSHELIGAVVPEFTTYPMYLLTQTQYTPEGGEPDPDHGIRVLERSRAHDPWRASFSVSVPADAVTLPSEPVTATPEQVAAGLAALEVVRSHLETGAAVDADLGPLESPRTEFLAWADSTEGVSINLAEVRPYGGDEDPVAPGGPIQVTPVDGGLLVTAALTFQFNVKADPGITLALNDLAYAKVTGQTGQELNRVRALGVTFAAVLVPDDGSRPRVIGGYSRSIAPRV